jgi:hypothetical protein
MMPASLSFFTLEAAVCGARSLSESEARTYVVVDVGDEPADAVAGPWRILAISDLANGWYPRPRVVCTGGTFHCVPAGGSIADDDGRQPFRPPGPR